MSRITALRFSRPSVFVLKLLYPLFGLWTALHREAAKEHYRGRFRSAGPDFRFDPLTSSFSYEQMVIGTNVYIGPNARFNGPVQIGDDVMVGPDVHVRAGGHRFDLIGSTIEASGPGERRRIVIGDDVWVAGRVTILRGVTIGEGTVVANGAVVTRDLPPYVIGVGNPCRPIRKRFSDEELAEHLHLRGRTASEAEALITERNRVLNEGTHSPAQDASTR